MIKRHYVGRDEGVGAGQKCVTAQDRLMYSEPASPSAQFIPISTMDMHNLMGIEISIDSTSKTDQDALTR